MRIHFKGTNYQMTPEVNALAKKRLDGLLKFIGKNKDNDAVHAYVELGKGTESHQSGRIWRAEINFDVEGARYRAAALAETIENAINIAFTEVAREIKNARKKRFTLFKKGGGAIKGMLRSA